MTATAAQCPSSILKNVIESGHCSGRQVIVWGFVFLVLEVHSHWCLGSVPWEATPWGSRDLQCLGLLLGRSEGDPQWGRKSVAFFSSPLDTWEAPLSVGRFSTRDGSRESLLLIISPTRWSLACFYLFCPAWEIIPTNFQGVLELRWSWDCSLKERKGKSFPNLCIQAFQKCLPSQKRISGGDKK